MFKAGDRFVCVDGEYLYSYNAAPGGIGFQRSMFERNTRTFGDYFKECERFESPFITASLAQAKTQLTDTTRLVGELTMLAEKLKQFIEDVEGDEMNKETATIWANLMGMHGLATIAKGDNMQLSNNRKLIALTLSNGDIQKAVVPTDFDKVAAYTKYAKEKFDIDDTFIMNENLRNLVWDDFVRQYTGKVVQNIEYAYS